MLRCFFEMGQIVLRWGHLWNMLFVELLIPGFNFRLRGGLCFGEHFFGVEQEVCGVAFSEVGYF